MEAKQTPLIELLERVPRDAALVVEHDQFSSSSHPVGRLCHEAADALRAALAEPKVEQEPVAITTKTQIEEMQHGYSRAIVGRDPKFWLVKRDDDAPLYTTPPRREWQGLTDEEITRVRRQFDNMYAVDWSEIVRAAEAALKEKNA